MNFIGSDFQINGVDIANLTNDVAFTVDARDVALSGILDDGSPFNLTLINANPNEFSNFFDAGATITVTLVPPTVLGDANQDGAVNFFDIAPFIAILATSSFLEEADCNQDGEVNFFDIASFIEILNGN